MKHIRGYGRRIVASISLIALLLLVPSVAHAATCATNPDQQSCSATYGISESFFGSGGLDTCPTQGSNAYCANMSAGELTTGNTKGTAYQAQAGFNTDRQPYIEMVVTKPAVNLGVVTTSTTGYDTAAFNVKSYLSNGYVVQIYGPPPTNGTHQVTTTTSPYTSAQGTEQFGINLVANTTPSVGANAVQDSDTAHAAQPFGFGAPATSPVDYGTANQFHYNSGDTIAQSTQSSGYTYYTISYIMNITPVTPGGTYTTAQTLVVTSAF